MCVKVSVRVCVYMNTSVCVHKVYEHTNMSVHVHECVCAGKMHEM